jgi:hypothetical protein
MYPTNQPGPHVTFDTRYLSKLCPLQRHVQHFTVLTRPLHARLRLAFRAKIGPPSDSRRQSERHGSLRRGAWLTADFRTVELFYHAVSDTYDTAGSSCAN